MPRCKNCNQKFKAVKFNQKCCLEKECREVEYESQIERLNSYNKKQQEKPNKPIKKVSDNQKEKLKIYSVLSKEFKKNKPICECCGIRPTTDVHHIKGRIGVLLNDFIFWLAVCRQCHTHIHENPRESRMKGWLI